MTDQPGKSDDAARAKEIRETRWKHAVRHRPRRLNCRLENFEQYGTREERDRQAEALRQLTAFRNSLLTDPKSRHKNLILFGPCGTGKDHLVASVLHDVVMAGATVEWQSGADMFSRIRDTMRTASAWSRMDVIEHLAEPQILVISDVTPQSGPLAPFDIDALNQVIDRRYELRLPVWVSINVEDGAEAAKLMGEKTWTRMRDDAVGVECRWECYREPASD